MVGPSMIRPGEAEASETLLSPGDESAPPCRQERDAAYRKLARRLVPLCFLTMVVCYMDRTNISLAAIDMSSDIGLTKAEFGTASSLFFLTYTVFQIPSNAILRLVGGPVWLGTLLIGWGLASSLTAFVTNVQELYALRLLLGLAEAGTVPGVLTYLARFFPESRTPAVFGISLSGSTVGMGISAPLAAGFLSMNGILNFKGWQWLLFLEGLPAIILGIVVMLWLPETIAAANFLTPRERKVLESGMTLERIPASQSDHFLRAVKAIVLNFPLWVIMFCGFLAATLRYNAIFWTPLWIDAIVNRGGLDWKSASKHGESSHGVQVALLSTIPYIAATFSSMFFGWTSEKLQDQLGHCCALWLLTGVCFLLLPVLAGASVVLGFVALVCGHVGVNGSAGPFYSIQLPFMTHGDTSFGLAWTNSFLNIGGMLGPMITGFLATYTGSYKSAIYVSGAMTVVAAFVVLLVARPLESKRHTLAQPSEVES